MLLQMGFTNVKNGGGLASMMAQKGNTSKTSGSNDPLVIDVRTPQEFKGSAFPGALNIPLDESPEHINKLGSHCRDITVYCASGARSSYAQQMLKSQVLRM